MRPRHCAQVLCQRQRECRRRRCRPSDTRDRCVEQRRTGCPAGPPRGAGRILRCMSDRSRGPAAAGSQEAVSGTPMTVFLPYGFHHPRSQAQAMEALKLAVENFKVPAHAGAHRQRRLCPHVLSFPSLNLVSLAPVPPPKTPALSRAGALPSIVGIAAVPRLACVAISACRAAGGTVQTIAPSSVPPPSHSRSVSPSPAPSSPATS